MVEKFRNILQRIKQDKGNVTLFMIMRMESITDKWSVILAAPWISELNKTETFDYLRLLLIENLTLEESSTIARIGVFEISNPIVNLITQNIEVESSEIQVNNTVINGLNIYEAIIFQSKRMTLSQL